MLNLFGWICDYMCSCIWVIPGPTSAARARASMKSTNVNVSFLRVLVSWTAVMRANTKQTLVYRRKLNLKAKLDSTLSYFSFKRLVL